MHLWSELRWSVLDPAWVASVFPKAATGFKGVTLWQKNREQKRDREGKKKERKNKMAKNTPTLEMKFLVMARVINENR